MAVEEVGVEARHHRHHHIHHRHHSPTSPWPAKNNLFMAQCLHRQQLYTLNDTHSKCKTV